MALLKSADRELGTGEMRPFPDSPSLPPSCYCDISAVNCTTLLPPQKDTIDHIEFG